MHSLPYVFTKLKAALLRVYLRSRLGGKSFVSNIKATQVQHTPVPSSTNGQKKLKTKKECKEFIGQIPFPAVGDASTISNLAWSEELFRSWPFIFVILNQNSANTQAARLSSSNCKCSPGVSIVSRCYNTSGYQESDSVQKLMLVLREESFIVYLGKAEIINAPFPSHLPLHRALWGTFCHKTSCQTFWPFDRQEKHRDNSLPQAVCKSHRH